MINDNDFLLLESYVEKTLIGEAKISFEERLKQEDELQYYLTLMLESDIILEEFDKEQQIGEWKDFLQTEQTQHVTPVRKLQNIRNSRAGSYLLSIAAMLLLFVAIYFIVPSTSNSPEQLASQYWTETAHFSYADARRGDTPITIENTTKKIYELHKTGNYDTALSTIEELSVSDEKMTLLKGSCYYNMGQVDNAIYTFRQITSLQNSYIEDEAKWYLALSYLKKGDIKMSKQELQEIINKKSWNYKLAQKLLNEIS